MNTPCPAGYVGILRMILLVFCLVLPFILLEDLGWLMVPMRYPRRGSNPRLATRSPPTVHGSSPLVHSSVTTFSILAVEEVQHNRAAIRQSHSGLTCTYLPP